MAHTLDTSDFADFDLVKTLRTRRTVSRANQPRAGMDKLMISTTADLRTQADAYLQGHKKYTTALEPLTRRSLTFKQFEAAHDAAHKLAQSTNALERYHGTRLLELCPGIGPMNTNPTFTSVSKPTTGPGEPGLDPWEREGWHLATLSDADLLAEVTDDEIEKLLTQREAERKRVHALELELDNARVDLDNTNGAIKRWLEELRNELRNGAKIAEPVEGSAPG
jgi:hypothetical protein